MRDFDVQFGTPSHGWMRVKVVAGDDEWHEDASDVPCDSIQNLVASLSMLVQGNGETTVDWSLEPNYAEWIFSRSGNDMDFVIRHSERTNPQLVCRGDLHEMVHRFIKALRKLSAEGCWLYEDLPKAAWSWPFPTQALLRLRSACDAAFQEPYEKSD